MRLDRARESVEPVRRADEEFEALGRQHILDPERDDRTSGIAGALGLAPDLRRGDAVRRDDQQEDPAAADRVDDRLAIILARHDVPRRDPAAVARLLKRRAGRVADRPVLRRMADEDVVRQCGRLPPGHTL
jgi:hypothetical protein